MLYLCELYSVCQASEIYFPNHCCGPDIVYKLNDVLYLVQDKFVDVISRLERVKAWSHDVSTVLLLEL